MTDVPPPRLHAILAREAPVGVILRRGPSKWVEMIHWGRETDEVNRGAWFRGRIYERRCDLSPDGSMFVYFAANWGQPDVTYGDTWTAVSRPPWLTALALWPKGDAWDGGGLFSSNRALWVNHAYDGVVAHEDHQPTGLEISTDFRGHGEDFPIYGIRLQRDGWTQVSELRGKYDPLSSRGFVTIQPRIYERSVPGGSVLRASYSLDNMHRTWAYVIPDGPCQELLSGAEWADVDSARGVVFARDGRLFRADLSDKGPVQIADFNSDVPTRRKSPSWARVWPDGWT